MGSNIPVDAFSPKTKAKITTINIPIPFMPDFDNPKIKTARIINNQCTTVKL